jgi:hypothetical protein
MRMKMVRMIVYLSVIRFANDGFDALRPRLNQGAEIEGYVRKKGGKRPAKKQAAKRTKKKK